MIVSGNKLKASDYNLEERVVATHRVTKVVEGGRRFSSSAVVVVGNGNGVVGYGLGKAKELTDAIAKGVEEAKRNLIKIPILRGTIPHDAIGKYGGGRVLIKPAASGTGVIAGGGVRIVLESVGIKNVLSKSQGSSNAHNVVKATFDALVQLRDPLTIAKQRGITLEQLFNG
ncbi:30S ribosomal protein S5 [Candidatus Cardinium hertigii]|uniref:Small ribosomal subunit protein uS5 n=1 Tax=Candidatus Cardinium hertigii TaxID=247481 RepID=A0A2Z3L8K5_9BACT|nr:30S ribosomal protein S5 [Candidatus Cardinium hertigii]AWN81747.1 30S ribosomal protein S5 [Candidatus Cardinium hertigii]